MFRKAISLGFLVTILSSNSLAYARKLNLVDVRRENPPKSSVEPCPVNDNHFWTHWATERGYEHLARGDLTNAAICYEKAAEMWNPPNGPPNKYYKRIATILRELPKNSINIYQETFEESAKMALRNGNNQLASKLYELTAYGYSGLNIEGYYGRFSSVQGDPPLHRGPRPWPEGYTKAGYFFEKAASFTNDKFEKRRLFSEAIGSNSAILTSNFCNGVSDSNLDQNWPDHPNYCEEAKQTVVRLEKTLKEI